MSDTNIPLQIQPPRSYSQKRRLARNMRSKGISEKEIKRVVWHRENSPTKKLQLQIFPKPTSPFIGGRKDRA